MLQVFRIDVAKVDQKVTYVAMVVHVCCKCLSRCCICFTHMLQIFYLDVAYVCNCFRCF
jgi:hypothetical protein